MNEDETTNGIDGSAKGFVRLTTNVLDIGATGSYFKDTFSRCTLANVIVTMVIMQFCQAFVHKPLRPCPCYRPLHTKHFAKHHILIASRYRDLATCAADGTSTISFGIDSNALQDLPNPPSIPQSNWCGRKFFFPFSSPPSSALIMSTF